MARIIIAGFGCAGYSAVKAMREAGCQDEILVFSNVAEAPYNPMLTTYYISGKVGRSGMFPFGTLSEIASKYDLVAHTEKTVAAVHVRNKNVELNDGSVYGYDKLLIATGASAFAPPIKGVPGRNIFMMRTLHDADSLLQTLEEGDVGSAVVVGASMAGIKVAELFIKRGISCTLADFAKRIFPLAALPDTAERIEERVRKKGVNLLFGAGISEIEDRKDKLISRFSTGDRLESDVVVLCIGTRANTALVNPAEIRLGRGILVDDHMQTSAKDVYAAGDCCEGRNLQSGENQIIGLWANAEYQGRCAGRNMAGLDSTYQGNILHNITGFMGTYFIGMGDNRSTGTVNEYEAPDGGMYIETVSDDTRITCLNIIDACEASGIIKTIFMRQFENPRNELSLIELARLRKFGIPDRMISVLRGH